MTQWFINFCAPILPNDPTLNFHRNLQACLLLAYTLCYAALHLYHTICAAPSSEPKQPEAPRSQRNQDELESESYQSQASNNEASLKCDGSNSSVIQLRKTKIAQAKKPAQQSGDQPKQQETGLQEIKEYFPIVYGHFAVSLAVSIMYTPYAEQSLAAILYIILTVPLLLANSRRSSWATRWLWIVISVILMFMLLCGLLEVGQSNWDVLNLGCFANRYVPLYD